MLAIYPRVAVILAVALLWGAAQAADPTAGTPPATTTPAATTNPTKPATEDLTDAQIASLLASINQGEIDLGKYVVSKTTNADVKNYAQKMIDDHTGGLAKAEEYEKKFGTKPVISRAQTDFENTARKELTDLGNVSGAALDKRYIDGAVGDHQKVLALIDTELIPRVDDAGLKTLIQDTRAKVVMHLDDAKKIQASMTTKQPTE